MKTIYYDNGTLGAGFLRFGEYDAIAAKAVLANLSGAGPEGTFKDGDTPLVYVSVGHCFLEYTTEDMTMPMALALVGKIAEFVASDDPEASMTRQTMDLSEAKAQVERGE